MSANGDGGGSAFGRVDADGTVYVRTGSGEGATERAVGQWPDASHEEALAHYVRAYEDLVTEVDLLSARLTSGAADPRTLLGSVHRLRGSLDTAAVVGDLQLLAEKLDALAVLAEKRVDEDRAAKAEARERAATRKQELVAEAEQIAAESTQWKAAGDRLRDILEEWKTIKGVDRKTDSELWKRYAAARDAFTRRRGTHFAGLDAQRKQAQGVKETLVTEAEELADSTDWGPTASRLKQLMSEWKAAGRASREAEERLWAQFRAAQDKFFSRRSEVFAERDAEYRENQEKKEALLAEAEAIDVSDPKAAQSRMRAIQSRWEAVGWVPRDAIASLDRRMRTVEEKVREALDAEWRRGAAESNPLLAQMRTQVQEAEQRLERAKAAGDRRRIKDAEESLASKRRFLELAEQAK
jgi:hypothetical protein